MYTTPNHKSKITPDDLSKKDKKYQMEVMKIWFLSNYEDPVESCPYESREGGYHFIWGGPYDAQEELEDEFSSIIPFETIKELADDLSSDCWEWSGQPEYDYDDYYDVISSNTEFHGTFTESLNNIQKLLEINIQDDLKETLYKLLYVNIITALETFLSDAFINTVLNDDDLLRKFVENNKDFSSKKLSLDSIFSRYENIEKESRDYLLSIVWHNLDRVKPLYKSTLGIYFPDITPIFNAIDKRHHIVHRNGKDKNGDEVTITEIDILNIADEARKLVDHIDNKFGE